MTHRKMVVGRAAGCIWSPLTILLGLPHMFGLDDYHAMLCRQCGEYHSGPCPVPTHYERHHSSCLIPPNTLTRTFLETFGISRSGSARPSRLAALATRCMSATWLRCILVAAMVSVISVMVLAILRRRFRTGLGQVIATLSSIVGSMVRTRPASLPAVRTTCGFTTS